MMQLRQCASTETTSTFEYVVFVQDILLQRAKYGFGRQNYIELYCRFSIISSIRTCMLSWCTLWPQQYSDFFANNKSVAMIYAVFLRVWHLQC